MEQEPEILNETEEVNDEKEPNEVKEVDEEQDIAAMLAEAEMRGYRRAMNEQAEMMMQRPALGERTEEKTEKNDDEGEVMILNRVKRSIWD